MSNNKIYIVRFENIIMRIKIIKIDYVLVEFLKC